MKFQKIVPHWDIIDKQVRKKSEEEKKEKRNGST